MKWFNTNDIKKYSPITIDNLHGYVLPHAGTKFTGNILSHSLRFRPKKKFKYILIIYYPAYEKPNVMGKYFHEYYVLENTLKKFFKNKIFIGYNLLEEQKSDIRKLDKNNTLFVVSADFSHFLPTQKAIKLENCSAHALMHNHIDLRCTQVVDHIESFKKLYSIVPSSWVLQWVGRTRSPGTEGVGYLSFLLRERPKVSLKKPDGFFVTAYDIEMRQRECLGNTTKWSRNLEKNLIKDVLSKARVTSRLTGGMYTDVPVRHYSVTYLYKDRSKNFIRGWHAIQKDALYLPDVFLENTYDNGMWIKRSDKQWKRGNHFNLNHTFKKLQQKSGRNSNNTDYQLYYSEVSHRKV